MTDRPLVIDLDDTLIRTDLLVEAACRLAATRPFACARLPLWLLGGKAALKTRLAEEVAIDPALLPYNEPLLDHLRRERANGRPLYLASASPRKFVAEVARHLDLFDGWFATENENLSGRAKAKLLTEKFGPGGFDYVGNSMADLPVWEKAGRAIAANASFGVLRRFSARHPEGEVFSRRAPHGRALVKALRPHQWLKNLLIFVPILAGHVTGSLPAFSSLLAFVAFSLGASATYVLNDLADLESDRRHRSKRNRPFAAGQVPVIHGLLMFPLLLLASLALGMFVGAQFLLVLIAYMAITLSYSLGLKRLVLIDVMTLAGLYTLRIMAGSAASQVPVSYWLLMFSLFLFFCLALVKRYTELKVELERGGMRPSGRGYSVADLPVLSTMASATGFGAVLIVALYVNSDAVRVLYARPDFLWLICPLLFYWIARVLILAHRGEMHDDPVVFAATDWQSLVVGLGVVLTAALATMA
ncbi:MAG TPA: UbiA family prenyltransferase [Rhizomicrobium sp.]|nr:UbiA family prenyltransferase [Rhizomicrobium sp.]